MQEGGIVEVTCVAEGSPYPTITWWNNNRLVTGSRRVTVSSGGQHLRIQDAEVYDQGEYVCVAENSVGRVEAPARITVLGESPRPRYELRGPPRRAGGARGRQGGPLARIRQPTTPPPSVEVGTEVVVSRGGVPPPGGR